MTSALGVRTGVGVYSNGNSSGQAEAAGVVSGDGRRAVGIWGAFRPGAGGGSGSAAAGGPCWQGPVAACGFASVCSNTTIVFWFSRIVPTLASSRLSRASTCSLSSRAACANISSLTVTVSCCSMAMGAFAMYASSVPIPVSR